MSELFQWSEKPLQRPLVISQGDPTGVGPEVLIKALIELKETHLANRSLLILCTRKAVEKALSDIGEKLPGEWFSCERLQQGYYPATSAWIFLESNEFEAGSEGYISERILEAAVDLVKTHPGAALVTGPIDKNEMQKAGFNFPGHTEFLKERFNVDEVAMMLANEKLKVVVATTHIPFRSVAKELSIRKLLRTIQITRSDLVKRFRIEEPRIAICGLNPHAGEKGLFGNEEARVLYPAIRKARLDPLKSQIDGPVSADTVFHKALEGAYDAVIALYHDQGLIPVKTVDFWKSVNITCGLPFVRTSVDHGTAKEIVGKNQARPDSMVAAIQWADCLQAGNKPKEISREKAINEGGHHET